MTNQDIRDIIFKTTVLKSSLCDYIDPYILVERRIKITGQGDNPDERHADERKKE